MTEPAFEETVWTALAARKVERLLGPAKAKPVVAEVLSELGLTNLQSEDDLARFGNELVRRGGFLGALGASLQTLALMHRMRPLADAKNR